ncbi:hypothetical protein L905_10100 [Agrobacterium sp. TS43]|nr:hypothetical protein L904_15745 [Agrobacterium sp. LY4]KVK51344.1 hypothetical protein L903_16225 [Agrobacterium sp. JL28]KVK63539.1 hypothetical protein L906_16170 [Agrobacterium sp. TS45]KVK67968.1 hypothetical protein L907_16130 [Agrobacterium sp. C13]KVK70571.1 hypothetical protein L905_10100 [Agrobacterium sp. TS43]
MAEKAVSPRSIEYRSKVSPVSTSVRTFRPNGSAIFAAAASSLTPFSSAGPSASAEQSIRSPVLSRPEIVTEALPGLTSGATVSTWPIRTVRFPIMIFACI